MEAMVKEEPFHFLPVNERHGLFAQVGVKPDKGLITYCVKGYVPSQYMGHSNPECSKMCL
jgi:hypothetical protein